MIDNLALTIGGLVTVTARRLRVLPEGWWVQRQLCDATTPPPSSARVTLAHQLTHVVQQRSGPVDGTPAPGER